MTHKLQLEIIRDGFSIANLPDRGASAARREFCFKIAPRSLRAVIVAGAVVAACPALFAQIHTETAHPAVTAQAQANGVRAETPETARSTPDPATTESAGGGTLRAAATISGTVLDVNGDLVPGAKVVLNDASSDDRREVTASDNAAFTFDSVKPGVPYEITVEVQGFSTWTSPAIVLEPSQFMILDNIHLKMAAESTSITVYGGSTEEIAVEQVHLEEQQRVLGFIPNFYVVYDSANAVPLTTKLKFQLAMKVSVDPITIAGVAFMSGIDQASNTPDYVQGAKGFGQRFGANAAGGFTDILLGGAVLPSLLHQDPRYFYQGTGSTPSRLHHAMMSPFICRGDNGHREINFSSVGGVLGATALSKAYYPSSNRGTGDLFMRFGISEAERVMAAIAQEFILPRFTPSLKHSRAE